MSVYKINLVDGVLVIGFGDPAQNTEIVPFVDKELKKMVASGVLAGTEVLKINGPASLPVAMTIAHAVCHIVKAVACFDPKLNGYVVAICHGPEYTLGQLIPA